MQKAVRRRRETGLLREILDDPIVRCMERRGYPPWFFRGAEEYTGRDAEADRGKDENEQR